MNVINLSQNFSIGPRMALRDLQALADEGFTDIVCNLPDTELPEGPLSDEVSRSAQDLGLKYHYLPIQPGQDIEQQVIALRSILRKPGTRTFAYCRSGARAAKAFELAV